jgi:hypothetical protein
VDAVSVLQDHDPLYNIFLIYGRLASIVLQWVRHCAPHLLRHQAPFSYSQNSNWHLRAFVAYVGTAFGALVQVRSLVGLPGRLIEVVARDVLDCEILLVVVGCHACSLVVGDG